MSKPPANPNARPLDPLTGTTPDDIPPVHVLEAAQAQDRKETEDLLAGFDRPGRGPKRPASDRDFVDFYTRKERDGARVRVPPPGHPKPSALPTVAKARWDERPAREMPAWAGWLGIAAVMLAIGGIVAFVATSEPASSAHAAATATSTTLTSSFGSEPSAARDAIPAPPPQAPPTTTSEPMATTPTTIVASPSAPSAPGMPSGRRDRHASPGAPANSLLPAAGPGVTGPTRDDMIRDM